MRRNVGRVRDDQVGGLPAGPVAPLDPENRGARFQPAEREIFQRKGRSGRIGFHPCPFCVRKVGKQGREQAARPRTQIGNLQLALFRHQRQRNFDRALAVRPRDQRARIGLQLQPVEARPAKDMLQRLARFPPRDRRFKPRLHLGRHHRLRHGDERRARVAERLDHQELCIMARVVDPGGSQAFCGGTDHLFEVQDAQVPSSIAASLRA